MSPPRRQITDFQGHEDDGTTVEVLRPKSQSWGYMSREDRQILGEVWDFEYPSGSTRGAHPQGIQVRPRDREWVIEELEKKAAGASASAGGAS